MKIQIHSLFTRLFIYFLLFTLLLVGTIWIAQQTFLPSYYKNEKVRMVTSYLEAMDQAERKGGINQEFLMLMEEYAQRLNGRILVLDRNGTLVATDSATGPGPMRDIRISMENLQRALKGETVLYTTEGSRNGVNFLVILSAGENYLYMLQTPLQAIEDTLAITQGFYVYLLLGGMLVATGLAWFFARRISEPLLKLHEIAGEMKSLRFEKKWKSERTDEIGELGNALNEMSSSLEMAIGDLEAELAKEKNLDKMRKEFVARVSHELQTPIAIINGYLEAIADGIPESDEERSRYFSIIESETDKMSSLVRDLLDLGQLESGAFAIKRKHFRYGEILDRRLEKFAVLAEKSGCSLERENLEGDLWVLGDPYRIEQVLNNLLQNALTHCRPGGRILVRMEKDEKKPGWLKTSVHNQGPNIHAEDLPHIWDSFYKNKEKKEGTGIGLAIVKNILELHHAPYGVENDEEGVTFWFSLEIMES